MALNEQALLVDLTMGYWEARKMDKVAEEEVENAFEMEPDNGHYWKQLIDKQEIKKIRKIVNKARLFHYRNAVAWGNNKIRLLPITNYFEYMTGIAKIKAEFDEAVANFISVYPLLVAHASKKLGKLCNVNEFPTIERVKAKFYFQFDVLPVPTVGDIRVNLKQDEIDAIKAQYEASYKEREESLTTDLWNRAYKVVKHLKDRLAEDGEGKYHASMVDNIKDLCSLLTRLNVTNNTDLEDIRLEMEKGLTLFEAKELKVDERAREATEQKADEILNKMKNFM